MLEEIPLNLELVGEGGQHFLDDGDEGYDGTSGQTKTDDDLKKMNRSNSTEIKTNWQQVIISLIRDA